MSATSPTNLLALNRWMKENNLKGYWTREEVQSYEPCLSMGPFLKWSDIQVALEGAAKHVDLGHAFRRNIGLENSTGRSTTINMGLQFILRTRRRARTATRRIGTMGRVPGPPLKDVLR